jgi:hypothetical protein
MDNARIDARMALARYESSFAAFGTEAHFTMKDVYVVREYIDKLEKAQGRLKEALRVNMIRYADAYVSHEDIDALIDAAIVGNKK